MHSLAQVAFCKRDLFWLSCPRMKRSLVSRTSSWRGRSLTNCRIETVTTECHWRGGVTQRTGSQPWARPRGSEDISLVVGARRGDGIAAGTSRRPHGMMNDAADSGSGAADPGCNVPTLAGDRAACSRISVVLEEKGGIKMCTCELLSSQGKSTRGTHPGPIWKQTQVLLSQDKNPCNLKQTNLQPNSRRHRNRWKFVLLGTKKTFTDGLVNLWLQFPRSICDASVWFWWASISYGASQLLIKQAAPSRGHFCPSRFGVRKLMCANKIKSLCWMRPRGNCPIASEAE